MRDKYEDVFDMTDDRLVYSAENIPCTELEDEYLDEFVGCECNRCTESCPCSEKSGGRCVDGRLLLNGTGRPLHECHTNCFCDKSCSFRLTQFGPIDGLEVKKTEKGYGLFTSEGIPENRFICEYAGELITEDEASSRSKSYKSLTKMNYILSLSEHFGTKLRRTIVDPTRIGNIGRFVNHSCDPNCTIVPVRVGNDFPKLCIFAKREIGVGEEVTFDYGSKESGLISDGDINKTKCLCGSEICKGFLPCHVT